MSIVMWLTSKSPARKLWIETIGVIVVIGFVVAVILTASAVQRLGEIHHERAGPVSVVRVCPDGSPVYRYPDGRLRWGGYIVEDVEKFCESR